MCFSLAGRLQTRAVALLHALILAILFAGANWNLSYFTMFFWMVGMAFVLDLFVYSRWIGYQPRWLTIVLGVFEFFLLFILVPGPKDLGQMLGFYLLAWLAGWLTLEILLPLAWPRWAEDAGEFRQLGK